jgi:predicted membrane protein
MNIAVFFNSKQTLRSVPRDGEQYIAVFGDITVDLRQVNLPESLRLAALAIIGDVKLTVPAGTEIVWSGLALLGDQKFEPTGEPAAEPVRRVIYLNGIALVGDVKVVEAIA